MPPRSTLSSPPRPDPHPAQAIGPDCCKSAVARTQHPPTLKCTRLHLGFCNTPAVVQEAAGHGPDIRGNHRGVRCSGGDDIWVGGYLYSRWGLFAGTAVLVLPRGPGLPGVAGAAARRMVAQGAGSRPSGGESAHRIALGEPPQPSRPAGPSEASRPRTPPPLGQSRRRRPAPQRCVGARPSSIALAARMRNGRCNANRAWRGSVPGAASAASAARTTVLIRHRTGSVAGREAAQLIADEARRTGVKVVGIRPVPDGAGPARGPLPPRRGRGRGGAPRLAAPPALGQRLEGAGEAARDGDAEDVARRPVGTGPHARGVAASPVRQPAS